MILSAIGDTGFAYRPAFGPDTVQRDVWIWDIFYTSFGLCLAAPLFGYKNFFSFNKIDTLSALVGVKYFQVYLDTSSTETDRR